MENNELTIPSREVLEALKAAIIKQAHVDLARIKEHRHHVRVSKTMQEGLDSRPVRASWEETIRRPLAKRPASRKEILAGTHFPCLDYYIIFPED